MNSNNNDDDSHTTLNHEQGGGDDDSCASSVDLLAPSPEKESNTNNSTTSTAVASPAPSISPSTQTLNVLSQHDAVGGGNLQYDMRNLSQDASAVAAASQHQDEDSQEMTASQQVQVSAQDDFAGWNLVTIALTEQGPLGMAVRRLPHNDPSKSYTIVHKVHESSQAQRAGILVGDVVAATYDEVTRWPSGPRPIGFSVLRKAKGALPKRPTAATTTTTQTKTPTANIKSSAAATTTTTRARTIVPNKLAVDEDDDDKTTKQDTQAAIILAHKLPSTFVPSNSQNISNRTSVTVQQQQERKSPSSTTRPLKTSSLGNTNNIPASKPQQAIKSTAAIPTTVVSFCRACRNPGSKGKQHQRAHHALCPKHPQYDNSGAKEKWNLICQGVELDCPACRHQHDHGRVAASIPHLQDCPRHKQPLRQHGRVVLGMVDPVLAPPVYTTTNNTNNKSESIVDTTEKTKPAKSKSAKTKATTETTKSKTKTTARTRKTNVEASQGSQSVTFASSSTHMQDTSTQETFTSTGRRIRKKRRYNYDAESESDNDAMEQQQQSTQLSSSSHQRSSLTTTRSKFTEKGCNIPLVVDTKKKQSLASRKKAKKSQKSSDAPIKPNWIPCENPWGSSGHQQGDVVLVTPSGGFTHHETIYGGDRFTASPFGSDSDYGVTHRTPSEGFDVILLSRDPNAEHPWGFEFRRHEFGGACLVTSIDPLSPAASAVYRGNETEQTSGAHLRIHDMILSMNGKSIGGMTELGVSVELGVCGRELELVVARYRDSDGAVQQLAALEQSEWNLFDQAVGNKRRLDWFEMNTPGAKPSPRIPMLEENEFSPLAFQGGGSNRNLDSFEVLNSPHFGPTSVQNDGPPVRPQLTPSRLLLASPAGSTTSRRTQGSQMSSSKRSRSDSVVYEDDDEAWLGCVCGEVHEEPIRVFWIQCDDCRSWYNVAPVCVGFKELEASSVGTWVCRACDESVKGDQASASNRSRPSSLRQTCRPKGSFGKRLSTLSQATPTNLVSSFATPGSAISRRSTASRQEILEDRKKRKTNDGCFLPLRSPRKKQDGTYARPCGRAPPGMEWDNIQGVYTPRSKTKASSTPVPSKIVIAQRPTAPSVEKKNDSTLEAAVKMPPTVALPTAAAKTDRRTDDGCFVPLRTPTKKADGTFARPCGRAPPGMTWDAIRGLYVPKGKLSVATASSQAQVKSAAETSSVGKSPVSSAAKHPESTTLISSASESEPSPLTRLQITQETDNGVEKASAISLPAAASSKTQHRRTDDGCFVPLRTPTKRADGTFTRPCGRAPPGMTWDGIRGLYVSKSKGSDTTSSAPSSQSNAQSCPKESGCVESPSPEMLEPPSQDATNINNKQKQVVAPVITASKSSGSGQRQPRGSRKERDADIIKRTTKDGCLIPKTAPTRKEDGTFVRPSGRCPPGKVFCPHRGLFVPKSKLQSKSTIAVPTVQQESSRPVMKIDASKIKLTVVGSGMTNVVISPNDASLQTSVPTPVMEPESSRSKMAIDASKIKLSVVGSGMKDVVIPPTDASLAQASPEQESMEDPKKKELVILPVGTLVSVAERVWIGCNKSGGIGTIIDYKHAEEDGTVLYDVKYSLGGRERGIDSQWVTAHDFSKHGTEMRAD